MIVSDVFGERLRETVVKYFKKFSVNFSDVWLSVISGGTFSETSTYMTKIEMGGEHQEDGRPGDGAGCISETSVRFCQTAQQPRSLAPTRTSNLLKEGFFN